jgi:hypothetical protein
MAQSSDLSRREMDRQKLVQVFSTQDEMEARMVQEILQEAGIESIVNARISPNVYPFSLGPLAKRDILVLESDVQEAERMIAELQTAAEIPDSEIPEEEP